MPSFSQSLETALHRALEYANERHHEYATLEHLLLSLLDDRDAAGRHAGLQRRPRRAAHAASPSTSTTSSSSLFVKGSTEAQPTTGFQRVIHRAVVHVQSSGREEVTGANVLVAIFAERESHAAFFLQEQEMTRFDAVQYISHGIAKRPGMSEPRRVRGVDEDDGHGQGRREEAAAGCAQHLLRQPQQEGQGRQDRSADRARAGGAAHHPGAVPPAEEQPAVRRRSRRRQDRDRRGPGAQDHRAARCRRC